MKALHFGAGNIGRGFIGKTLSESGFNVIFSDINQNIVDTINNNKEYSVRIIGKNKNYVVNVTKVSAINFNDIKTKEIIASVSLITTAVGPLALNKLASILADGIILKIKKESIKPLNIIACENKVQASSALKKAVLEKICTKYHDYLDRYIGFVDCSIDTIIPVINHDKNNLFLMVEEFKEWIVNSNQFKGSIPNIIGMKLSNNLNPFIERKLLTLNTGHAIAAYLGLIKKHKTIHDAIVDKTIRPIVRLAMEESGAVLIKRHNFNKKDHLSYINKIFFRFENPFLSDTLERIARNPLQKLGKEERLIKPLLGSIEYKLPYINLAKGVAAAFHYQNQNDLESIKISSLIKRKGIKKTLIEICHLSENSPEVYSIISEYMSILKTII
ncbi:mannitol-1-phosphate 5-dehydrogenase [Buchnera aphidicola]|uniref:Mannitol-1-phosphate 5-dehydrogenase n=1 Tax=Buchnera aphidicola str. USDA (Myzus persicae) TaxID=1009856 RepID=W0P394_BUCMP|nr:mannitol-1-phosphate 5-dehydrogenase [Buchnera aphidicola]AHG59835.1 Mtld [Buchnera aphidicola str. USDA (Myzus persicae)]AHG60415.1 Mtld [Buchnera aphidicola str. W106 (Myzus persicae)]AHG60988.1 Mtld [Buchnera aphidicola str. G002 (Myzus persicae)]AHG61560.1 Mtld [Buchnera aphidicola str. F009 (Myzus persicae)]WAI02924.1 MAG: mannitol-1-phosphate 5-dehydrogenase [Buchnera aphidicola (Myzus persicae)]